MSRMASELLQLNALLIRARAFGLLLSPWSDLLLAYPFRMRDQYEDPRHRNGSLGFQDDSASTKKGFRWLRGGDFRLPEAAWRLQVASVPWSKAISTP